MKKLFLGLAVSAAFVYLSLRGADVGNIITRIGNVNLLFLLPAVLLSVLITALRSYRWGVILSTVEKTGQRVLFPITCVGFMAIVLAPFRMGEVVRPYLVSSKGKIPFSSAIATIFVERVMDSLAILGVLFLVVFTLPVPGWVAGAWQVSVAAFTALISFMLFLYFKKSAALRALSPLLVRLPSGLRINMERIVHKFVEGFVIVGKPKKLLYVAFLSVFVWLAYAASIYAVIVLFGFSLPPISAFAVLVFLAAGISLPTAPGMLGNYHYACILALSLFGVPKEDALAFSVVNYFVGIVVLIILGLIFLPFTEFSLKKLYIDLKRPFSSGGR